MDNSQFIDDIESLISKVNRAHIDELYDLPTREVMQCSYSDNEGKEPKRQFRILYKRTKPLNIEVTKEKKSLSQCGSESFRLKKKERRSGIKIRKMIYNIVMNLNKYQVFTFGNHIAEPKHPKISKASVFYRMNNLQSEQGRRPLSDMDKENQPKNEFIPRRSVNNTRMHTSPNKTRRLSYNSRQLPQLHTIDCESGNNRYKNIALKLKGMFERQRFLQEIGSKAELDELYISFQVLCRQI